MLKFQRSPVTLTRGQILKLKVEPYMQYRPFDIIGKFKKKWHETASRGAVLKLKLLDFSIGRYPYLITLLFAFSGFAFSDEFIEFLRFDPITESLIQGYAIKIFILLLFAITFIQMLQHEQSETISSMESRLSEAQSTIQTQLKNINSLQEKNVQLDEELTNSINDMEYLCDGYLCFIAPEKLEFGKVHGCHERITLYSYDSSGYFTTVGRFSSHMQWRDKKRRIYPRNEGVIGKAWDNGCYFDNNYPDPNVELERYSQHCKEDGISDQTLGEMRMRSRLYFGYRIQNGMDAVAVIIVEATLPDRYDKIELKRIFDNQNYLSILAEKLSRWKPSLEDARKKGL